MGLLAMTDSTVSVLMANYNDARYLAESLGGVYAQTFPADEVIVVDDGSTDHSVEVITDFASRYGNLRLLRNDRNRGVQYSIGRALREASCDYVIWASADDRLLPEILARSVEMLRRYPQAGLCFSQLATFRDGTNIVRCYTGGGNDDPTYNLGEKPCYLDRGRLLARLASSYLWMSGNTVLIRREALLEAGGYRPELEWYAEWFAYYAVALRYGVCVIPETLALMRERPSTYSAAGIANPKRQRTVIRAVLTALKMPQYADLLSAFRIRPVLLSPLGRQLHLVLATSPRHFDLFLPFLDWYLRRQLRRIIKLLSP